MARTIFAFTALASCLTLLGGCKGVADVRTEVGEQKSEIARTDQFQAAASNGTVAVAVGNGVVVATEIAGNRQRRIVLDGAPALIAVNACPDGSFVALDFNRKVWSADANAGVWKAQSISGNWRPLALTCDNQNRYWVTGSGTTIASSADRGATWTEKNFGEDAMFNTIQFINTDNGIVTGEFGMVMVTSDGGANWQAAGKVPADFYPYAALFISPAQGYLSGLTGTILQTSNGGKTWEKLENPSGLPQYGFTRQGNKLYSVGASGSLLRLDGKVWHRVDAGFTAPDYLRSVIDLGDGRLLVAGGAGTLQAVPVDSDAAGRQKKPG